jgi:hypothetical protein
MLKQHPWHHVNQWSEPTANFQINELYNVIKIWHWIHPGHGCCIYTLSFARECHTTAMSDRGDAT